MKDQTALIDQILRQGNERGRFPSLNKDNPYGNVRVPREEQEQINASDINLIQTVQKILTDPFPDASSMPGELMDIWSFLEQQKKELMFVNQDSVPDRSVAKTMPSNIRSMLQSIIDRTSTLPTPKDPAPRPLPRDPRDPTPMSVEPDQELIEMLEASKNYNTMER
tara:strand:- start:246 stop:743 length:498 start_codon:yes stop_codon:yes gene_type:complete